MMDLSGPPGFILCILTGLVLGSFATAVTYRVPRGQSWIASKGKAEHSGCPSCGHRLSIPDLIPLLSWMALRGRCRYCRAAIGWRYPAIELGTMILCLVFYAAFGWTGQGIVAMLAAPFLMALVAIDLEHYILPDQINAILGVLGLGYVLALAGPDADEFILSFGSALLYAGLAFATSWIMGKILKKEAMGFGDVKFFAVAGLWLGLGLLPTFLTGAGLAGVILGVLWKFYVGQERFPFGPALILSFVLCLVFGSQIQGVLY